MIRFVWVCFFVDDMGNKTRINVVADNIEHCQSRCAEWLREQPRHNPKLILNSITCDMKVI